ncbi:proton channel OtopLc isoform X1 [Folsomia candida]|uniref:proton channel OtopLc isoform X1 n=1 Tax=Folsomia candida TaxID=158441 RepID=UPI001605222C|nr:proton channel OtopLc isoform X1 [Folsomia candida]
MVLHIVLPEPLQSRMQQHHHHNPDNEDAPPKVLYCNKKLWLTRPTSVETIARMDEPRFCNFVMKTDYKPDPQQPPLHAEPCPRQCRVQMPTCHKQPPTPTDRRLNIDIYPITTAEKRALFKGYLTIILSCIYAIFILMLGVVVYIADLISRTAILAEVFSVYLVALGLSWLIFLYCDIRRHQNRIRDQAAEGKTKAGSGGGGGVPHPHGDKPVPTSKPTSEQQRHQNGKTPSNNNSNNNHGKQRTAQNGSSSSSSNPAAFRLGSNAAQESTFNRHAYIFCHSRHSGSFYLKIGAAGFCFGHLIHSGLLLCRQIIFFTSDDDRVYNRCANLANLTLDVLFPIYSFLLLFVIFKYSNVIINRHKELSRFALMHCISSSLCFWFWSILRETAESILKPPHHKMAEGNSSEKHYYHYPRAHNGLPLEFPTNNSSKHGAPPPYHALPLGSEADSQSSVFDFLNASSAISTFYDPCVEFSSISELVVKMSPYLYPFSIEYSILIVGVLFIMWQNIGKGQDIMRKRTRFRDSNQGPSHPSPVTSFTNHLIIHADCHAANKGLFAGLLILVGTVISVIIFYIALDDFRSGFAAQWVNLTSQAVLLVIMIITVLCAYRQITKLDINIHAVSLLDDLLLFLCLPSFFLYTIFTVVPAMAHQDYYAIVVCSLQVIQVILQTPCIIDGLRRCSNSEELRRAKPGRELVTFLIVCNLAMWIIETFEIKSVYAQHEQISFYGSILWTLLSHMTLPLTLFYRFHSSVCLVDIWKSAYESTS